MYVGVENHVLKLEPETHCYIFDSISGTAHKDHFKKQLNRNRLQFSFAESTNVEHSTY